MERAGIWSIRNKWNQGLGGFPGLSVSHLCCFLPVGFILSTADQLVPHGRTRGCWQLLRFAFYGFHTGGGFLFFLVLVKKILGRDSGWPILAQDQWYIEHEDDTDMGTTGAQGLLASILRREVKYSTEDKDVGDNN